MEKTRSHGARRLVLAAGIAFFLAMPIDVTSQCTRDDAMKAEAEASSLKTWHEVYESYKRYRLCDDGAIAEGYSASIASLFANHWDQLERLFALTKNNRKFRSFVLQHLDQTMTSEQDAAIKKNVLFNCPAYARQLCSLITERLKELDRESTGGRSHK